MSDDQVKEKICRITRTGPCGDCECDNWEYAYVDSFGFFYACSNCTEVSEVGDLLQRTH